MKLANTPEFIELQHQTVRNAVRLAERLTERGLRIPYGGTNTHMLLVDVGQIKGEDGTPLSGDMVARILEIAGVVCNRNTIPGDKSPFRATGIRLGTPWITQRGFKEAEIDELADAIADLIFAMKPFSYPSGFNRTNWRAKVDYDVLISVQQRIADLANRAGIDYVLPDLDNHYIAADAAAEHFRVIPDDEAVEDWRTIEVDGPETENFLDVVLTHDMRGMSYGEFRTAWVLDHTGNTLAQAIVERITETTYLVHVSRNVDAIAHWFIALSDGYAQFDPHDVFAKVPGPISVSPLPDAVLLSNFNGLQLPKSLHDDASFDITRAYFIGCNGDNLKLAWPEALPAFTWDESADGEVKYTPLHQLHKELGAKMVPFAGYDMPVWYTSVSEEHLATRQAAGLFDVSHMGVFDFKGPGAEVFLNAITTNDVSRLGLGEAHYSYLLGTNGIPLDDIFVYRLDAEEFMVVVNASNNDKDWAWIQSIYRGDVAIDNQRPWVLAPGRDALTIRDLRDLSSGKDRRVDIALQGPTSRDVLFNLGGSDADKAKIRNLKWSNVVRVNFGGHDLIVSRTGYTGERMAFEIFPHPDEAAALFKELVEAGATPCGLAARDSLRTEAGLPLYGHELEGHYTMAPGDAGFGSYVKLWKPFFAGKEAYMGLEAKRDQICVRFRLDRKGVRPPHQGDPILDQRGRVVGVVTSCSIDSEGYQLGLALIKNDYTAEGTPVYVFSNADKQKLGKPLGELIVGDKTPVPETATILSRFPKR